MRYSLSAVLFFCCALSLRADTFVYVSMAPEKKIQVFRLDPADGKLTRVETLPVDGVPGALGTDPQKKFLFASVRSASALQSFQIDQATGKLKALGTVSLGKGNDAAYVCTDRTGRWLLSASYGGGKVVVHKINADGTIESPPVQSVDTAVTAHSCPVDASNHWVFVPHVTPNAVYQFTFDAQTGKLTDAGKAAGGAPKAGPRHLAFHPTLKFAYTSDESGLSITAYAFDMKTGLKPVQTLSTVRDDFPKKGNSTAEVKVHPSGKFVWVSNRGHDSLAGFAIDDAGKLTAIGQTPTEKTPRSFDVDPDGKYIFAAGEGSGSLAVFQVNLSTGALMRIGTYEIGKSVPWLTVVKMPTK